MGIVLAIVVGVIAVATAAASVVMATKMRTQETTLKPQGIDAFKPTSSEEGMAVPRVWGRCRVNANLLWYGNLWTQVDQEVGVRYWMDVWLGICQGPSVEIVDIYNNDVKVVYDEDTETPLDGLEFTSYLFNSGGSNVAAPSEPGVYATPITPIAHIFFKWFFCGVNVSQIPTLHFVVDRPAKYYITPYEVMDNGVNPASILYELLFQAGTSPTKVNHASFTDGADYWYRKGYGLNIQLNEKSELRDDVAKVFTYVDGCMRRDADGKFELKVFKNTDESVATLTKDDFDEFKFARETYDALPNSFVGTFLDEDQAFTERTVKVRNPAVRKIVGAEDPKSIDLRAYRDAETASKRLCEIVKQHSYPRGRIDCRVGQKFLDSVRVGDVVTISNDDYRISEEKYRVLERTIPELEDNYVEWKLEQFIEEMFDENYWTAGGSLWSPESYPLSTADAWRDVFELPYMRVFGTGPTYLALLNLFQYNDPGEMWVFWHSTNSVDHPSELGLLFKEGTKSQRCLLRSNMAAAGDAIDDDGVQLQIVSQWAEGADYITREVVSAQFQSVTRTDLFTPSRLALIGDELIAYQNLELTDSITDTWTMTGIIRGLYNTPISSHDSDDPMWLFQLATNQVTTVTLDTWYAYIAYYVFQIDPYYRFQGTPVEVNYEAKAKTPPKPSLLTVTRSGDTCSVEVCPNTLGIDGAGLSPAEQQIDVSPYEFGGLFQYYVTGGDPTSPTGANSTSFEYDESGAHTLYVRAVQNLSVGEYQTVDIGADDGVYYTDGYKVLWNSLGWCEIMNLLFTKLNDDMLLIEGMQDVEITSLADGDILQWDAAAGKWKNVAYTSVF